MEKSQIRGNWQVDDNLKYMGAVFMPGSEWNSSATCLGDYRLWDLVPELSGSSQTLFSHAGTLCCAPSLREHCSGNSDTQQLTGCAQKTSKAVPGWMCS